MKTEEHVHVATGVASDHETAYSTCLTCGLRIYSFWIDEEPGERLGRWSAWRAQL